MRIDLCRKCGYEMKEYEQSVSCESCGKEFEQFICFGCGFITEPHYHTHKANIENLIFRSQAVS